MDYRDPEWVAERLGIDKNTLYKFLHDGVVPGVQLGRKWLISESRLIRWLEEETDRQTGRRRQSTATVERTVKRMSTLTPRSRGLLREAYALARRWNHRHLGQEHLLAAMAGEAGSTAGRMLADSGLSVETIRESVQSDSSAPDGPPHRLGRKPRTRRAMRLAIAESQRLGRPLADPEHLLLGIMLAGESRAASLLAGARITIDRVRESLSTHSKKARATKEKP